MNVLWFESNCEMWLDDSTRSQSPAEVTNKTTENRLHLIFSEHLTDA